ncbi:MAG: RidA family protein [Ignavibacteria bacterium]|nr:MAG: RidA family protein [Ignavibacteria bacterium]
MIEERLNAMGIEIPEAPKPLAAYIPALRTGNLVMTAGQLPMKDGKLMGEGKLGSDFSIDQGKEFAKQCAINCLSVIKGEIKNLDKIKRIVKLTVFVNSADGFTAQPQVANGASEFMVELFGDNGKHVRSAVGVNELPINAPVELEMIVEVAE